MDTKFQTSFIPKKPLVPTLSSPQKRHINFFSIIAVLIFLLAVIAGGAVYGYEKILTKNIANMNVELAAAQASLDPALIGEWVRLDKRIESSKALLSTHIALSSFFTTLQEMTLKTVRFKNFAYSLSASKISITMDGEADSFAAVALQSDEFAKNAKYISNQLFSNIDLEKTGSKAVFRFTATLDPSLVSYKNLVDTADDASAEVPEFVDEVPATEEQRTLPRAGGTGEPANPTTP